MIPLPEDGRTPTVRRQWRNRRRPAKRSPPETIWFLALALLPGLSVACVPTQERLSGLPEEYAVFRLTGTPTADHPLPPEAEPLTVRELEGHLRRVVATHTTGIPLVYSPPAPLFSKKQIQAFAAVLAKELPTLAADQRLRFEFRGAMRGWDTRFEINQDGDFLVFRFTVLARDPALAQAGELPITDSAFLELQPGQEIDRKVGLTVLKEPVRSGPQTPAELLAEKMALLDRAMAAGIFKEPERVSLKTLLESRPGISPASWREFLEKRRILGEALGHQLLTKQEFRTRMAAMEAGLTE